MWRKNGEGNVNSFPGATFRSISSQSIGAQDQLPLADDAGHLRPWSPTPNACRNVVREDWSPPRRRPRPLLLHITYNAANTWSLDTSPRSASRNATNTKHDRHFPSHFRIELDTKRSATDMRNTRHMIGSPPRKHTTMSTTCCPERPVWHFVRGGGTSDPILPRGRHPGATLTAWRALARPRRRHLKAGACVAPSP